MSDGREMGELFERRWSVLSARGCEASGLVYDEAAQVVERLASEKIQGLCIVTDEAAQRAARGPRTAARRTAGPPR